MNKSKTTEQSVFFSLEKTSKVIKEKINEYLKEKQVNLTGMQWICLDAIYLNPGITQKALSQLLFKEEASISRIVKKLLEKGFLYRKKQSLDNKTQNLYASPNGIGLVQMHQKNIQSTFRDIFKNVYDREMNIVNDILKRVHAE